MLTLDDAKRIIAAAETAASDQVQQPMNIAVVDAGGHLLAFARQPGAWLTCIDPGIVRMQLGVTEANRISLDQTMSKDVNVAGNTPLKSMQVGLSTWYSFCDGHPCSNSRTISWSDTGKSIRAGPDPMTQ